MPSPQMNKKIVFILHLLQIPLVIALLAIGALRMFGVVGGPKTRNTTARWSMSVAAKSLIILQYEILTEHFKWFRRWYSIKAFLILNIIEVVFWIAAIVLTAKGMIDTACSGLNCTLNPVVIAICSVCAVLAVPVAVLTFILFRQSKAGSLIDNEEVPMSTVTSEESYARKDGLQVIENGHWVQKQHEPRQMA
ncbi:uncharacterized protein IL334_000821 [Kwoniella shivajii]|uniref:MARVEL domain-containing protein n=1 Tax=Kwoniella shivajii TaxID=564305 RepID=A0ABZ1CQ86_9TREE|nr:hypothetical protein IL334_000821 [Kwoniella shivajii]